MLDDPCAREAHDKQPGSHRLTTRQACADVDACWHSSQHCADSVSSSSTWLDRYLWSVLPHRGAKSTSLNETLTPAPAASRCIAGASKQDARRTAGTAGAASAVSSPPPRLTPPLLRRRPPLLLLPRAIRESALIGGSSAGYYRPPHNITCNIINTIQHTTVVELS